jgi:hypothetical protein
VQGGYYNIFLGKKQEKLMRISERSAAEAAMRKPTVSMPEAYVKNGIQTAGSTSKN